MMVNDPQAIQRMSGTLQSSSDLGHQNGDKSNANKIKKKNETGILYYPCLCPDSPLHVSSLNCMLQACKQCIVRQWTKSKNPATQTTDDLREQFFRYVAVKWDTTNEKLIQNDSH